MSETQAWRQPLEPDLTFEFEAPLWLYSGKGAWHFVTLPAEVAEAIRLLSGPRRGFGQLPVAARIGTTAFRSSIFPDAKSGSYCLPVKADVRRRERLSEGDPVRVSLTVNP